jgi:hypothetical protein
VRVHVRGGDATARHGDLLFALGWGNRPGHEPVDWLLDGLVDRGWTVHAVVVPENGTNFARDYRDPLASIRDEVEPDACAGHSLGGLTLAHLPGDRSRAYASPFWGVNRQGLAGALVPALSRLPTARRILPAAGDSEVIGDLKPPEEDSAGDRGASPAWLRAVREAQSDLPAFREGSVAYCSLRDRVVSVRAIGDHAPADRLRVYDGGHEFFASSGREAVLDDFHADLVRIAAGDQPPSDPAPNGRGSE